MSRKTIANAMRQRRERNQFSRALREASPAMQQELYAAATRQSLIR
jgi:hypothetical protein